MNKSLSRIISFILIIISFIISISQYFERNAPLSVQINSSWFVITKVSQKEQLMMGKSKELCYIIAAKHTDGISYRRISKLLNEMKNR